MTNEKRYVRHGFGAVRPYVYGHLGLEKLLEHAFGAVELERQQMGPRSFHIETKIADSVVVLETGEPLPDGVTPGSIYVYVENMDRAYARALEMGATSVAAPEDKPYEERAAGVRDSFGNTWWIATFRRAAT